MLALAPDGKTVAATDVRSDEDFGEDAIRLYDAKNGEPVLTLELSAGYNVMSNFSEPVGLRDNFNGPQVAIGLGWMFGDSRR